MPPTAEAEENSWLREQIELEAKLLERDYNGEDEQ